MSENKMPVVNGVNLGGTEILPITERIKGRMDVIKKEFYELAVDLIELKEEFKSLKPAERKALGNLDGWCRKEFGFGQKYANKQIAAKVALDHLQKSTPTGVEKPSLERQIRPLTKLNSAPDKQAKVYQIAYEKAGKMVPGEDDIKNAISKVERGNRPEPSLDPPTHESITEPDEEPKGSGKTIDQLFASLEEGFKEYHKHSAEFKRLFNEFTSNLSGSEDLTLDEEDYAMAALFIKTAYRELSKKFHPDKDGGSEEQMVKLNRIKDVFITLIQKGI